MLNTLTYSEWIRKTKTGQIFCQKADQCSLSHLHFSTKNFNFIWRSNVISVSILLEHTYVFVHIHWLARYYILQLTSVKKSRGKLFRAHSRLEIELKLIVQYNNPNVNGVSRISESKVRYRLYCTLHLYCTLYDKNFNHSSNFDLK